jgi:hypothetical protein
VAGIGDAMAQAQLLGRERGGARDDRPRRRRRSSEEVSRAPINAAAELFAERPSLATVGDKESTAGLACSKGSS